MSISMGRGLGVLVLLHAFAACDPDSRATPPFAPDTGGAGGTEPKGTGGTDPKGTGGTDPKGDPDEDPDAVGQGGAAGAAGSAGSGGEQGFAGSAGQHNGPCESDCEPCENDYVFTECEDNRCVCEHPSNPAKSDYEELLACDLDEPCPPSTEYRDPGTARWEGGACLLTKLRDRTPGKYRFSSTFADLGSQTSDYTFLLNGSDEILVLDVQTSGLVSGNLTRYYWPVFSCTLKSYGELDACVTAGTDVLPYGSEDTVCDNTEDWFQDCEQVENPECPVE